ncbi:hypothetical protein K1719_019731 [Acacia pycnantha]|nr:hypothetical protein K1719_019731 [Acacia pycnantha]
MGQHSASASKNVADWSGTCYFTPLIGAFLADAYLGNDTLALSASIPGIKPTCNEEVENCHATMTQNAVAFLALYLIALGTGGIKPCVSSFGADQFDDTDEAEKEKKGSFFNWFYFSINIALSSPLL